MKQYFPKVLVNRYELRKFMKILKYKIRRLKFNSISLICCALKCLGGSCLKQQGGYRKGVHLKTLCLDVIEKVHPSRDNKNIDQLRKIRESYWIEKYDAVELGANTRI